MHAPFDQFGKNILRDLLLRVGDARPETEVPPGDAQRIDVWYMPDAARLRTHPGLPGVLAALAATPAVIEVWGAAPDEPVFHEWLRKRSQWHHRLELDDQKRWPMPPLWGLCAGRPDGLLDDFGFEPAPEGPSGHYRTAAPGWRVRLVVIRELPAERETLLLRLLGSGRVFASAIREVLALPSDALEKRVAGPWLTRLKSELQAADPSTISPEDKEIVMDVYEDYAEHERRIAAQAEMQARLRIFASLTEKRLGRPLTETERAILTDRLATLGEDRLEEILLDTSADSLATWLADPAAE